MAKVNLDALISREDFEVNENEISSQPIQTVQIRDFEQGTFFYHGLRKPDFQRETSEWDSQKILDLITSFLDGDLIPAIILWNSGRYVFTIDGAHRLSALISWVNDDYGDGLISKPFFEHSIEKEQASTAEVTRKLVNSQIGSYQEYKTAIQNQSQADPKILKRAQRLASLALQLQWVKGDAAKAEESFFKINQKASPIDETELKLLKSRNKSNALTARAIIRSGKGHKYWSKFIEEKQKEIEDLAKDINEILFEPQLRTPIKTLDLPIAGKKHTAQTLSLVFDLVNLVNDVKESAKEPTNNEADKDGDKTIKFLENTRRIAYRISGNHPSSLGLHPIVYFYNFNGRYQPTAFLAIVEFMKDLEKKKKFDKLTNNRAKFEDFLLKHKYFINQITYKLGSGLRGYKRAKEYFDILLDELDNEMSEEQILTKLISNKAFSFLKLEINPAFDVATKDFSSNTKSYAFIKEALQSPLKCKICGGLIHSNSISIDHINRKEDGGLGHTENAQLSHPYCNSTHKN